MNRGTPPSKWEAEILVPCALDGCILTEVTSTEDTSVSFITKNVYTAKIIIKGNK